MRAAALIAFLPLLLVTAACSAPAEDEADSSEGAASAWSNWDGSLDDIKPGAFADDDAVLLVHGLEGDGSPRNPYAWNVTVKSTSSYDKPSLTGRMLYDRDEEMNEFVASGCRMKIKIERGGGALSFRELPRPGRSPAPRCIVGDHDFEAQGAKEFAGTYSCVDRDSVASTITIATVTSTGAKITIEDDGTKIPLTAKFTVAENELTATATTGGKTLEHAFKFFGASRFKWNVKARSSTCTRKG